MKTRMIINCAVALVLILFTADFGGGSILNIVDTLERQSADWRLERHAESGRKNKSIVIVDIDRDSLQAVGTWPWPRDQVAKIISRLSKQYEVRAAAFLFPLTAPDDEGLAIFDKARDMVYGGKAIAIDAADGFNLHEQLENFRGQFDYDEILAEAMKGRQIILGYNFNSSARVEGTLPPPTDLYNIDSPLEKIPDTKFSGVKWNFYRGYEANLEKILDASAGAGFVNFTAEDDGFVRRMPLLARHARKNYESLALALLRRSDVIGQTTKLFAEKDGATSAVSAGGNEIHLTDEGDMYLHFYGIGGAAADFENSRTAVFRYISAYDVMRGKAPKEMLQDKIVLIGSSSEALRDIHPTPLNPAMPGAELLATQIANILNDEILRRLPSTDALAFAALVAGGLLFALVSVLLTPVMCFLLTAAVCAGVVYASIWFWEDGLQIISLVGPLFVFIGLFLSNSISGFVFEWRSSRNLKSSFGQYVPPELAKRIGERHSISLEGENREISVLFSDVRNFTSISETFTPKELTVVMNRMLTGLSEAVHQNDGTVDKFIGDAVMAFWNAPLDEPEHASKSVASAIAMQEAMRLLSSDLEREGHSPMRLGVGICTGNANVGNMGSKLRMAYTAMGDTVNVASRVEGLTKYYKVGILVTESTRDKCESSGIIFRMVDHVRVKGREQPLKIYEPLGEEHLLAAQTRASLSAYNAMRRAYVKGDFAAAAEKIKEYRANYPEDLLGEVYEERINGLLQAPPEDWDGITEFETK
ncbi:MAG: CHASE2 domain-containing protein [Gammaproteobacteria bacterium]